MSKEEFIKLIETLEFEELRCANISYYKTKPKRNTYYNDDTEDYNPKTICIGTDLEHLINDEHSRTNEMIEHLWEEINKIKEIKND